MAQLIDMGPPTPTPHVLPSLLSISHNNPFSVGTAREICKICFDVNRVGFHVPDEVWQAAIPEYYGRNIVCLTCFTRLADERAIPWDHEIEFFPVSLVSHFGMTT